MLIRIIILILIAVILANYVQAVIINEIYYDAIGGDEDKEWIEIYNNGTDVDLTGWKLFEAGTNHFLNLKKGNIILTEDDYAVIADDWAQFLIDYPDYDGILFDSTFSLSNTGEELILKNSSLDVVDSVSYSESTGGNGNGFSIGKMLEVWEEVIPSPGFENEDKNEDLCDIQVDVVTEKDIFDNKTDVNWKYVITNLLGDDVNVRIERYVKDEFDVEQTEYKILNRNITRKETIKHSPNLKPGIYILSINTTVDCKDRNLENNFKSKLIAVKDKQNAIDSTLDIEGVRDLGSDNKAKWGQVIRVRINVYKGDTTKSNIKLFVRNGESVSKQTKTLILEKFTNQTLTLPLQLDSNCNGKFKDGTYEVVLDGLGERDLEEIEIEGITNSNCENIKSIDGKLTYEFMEIPRIINKDEITITLKVENNEDQKAYLKIWSYLYRGSKSLTGDRELNSKTVVIPKKSSKIISLENVIENDIEEGESKLKVKILKQDRKTADELTEDVFINFESDKSDVQVGESTIISKSNSISEEVIYKSSDVKAGETGLYFFMGVLVILFTYLAIKKDL